MEFSFPNLTGKILRGGFLPLPEGADDDGDHRNEIELPDDGLGDAIIRPAQCGERSPYPVVVSVMKLKYR